MNNKIDPRTKLLVSVCLSSFIIITEKPVLLFMVLTLGIVYSMFFGAGFFMVLKRMRKLLMVFFGIIVLQSVFNNSGNEVLSIAGIRILTDTGIIKGIAYILRVFIILLSGSIIVTSGIRVLIQGLIKLRIPYDIAFMTSVGIKFMPLLVEEVKDTFTAIQLKGIDIKRLKLKEKIELYSYIFLPVITGTLVKAKHISRSIEMRGFRAYPKRTSTVELKLLRIDYLIMVSAIVLSGLLIFIGATIM
jgi:energy-coupling factor transport system permease protein